MTVTQTPVDDPTADSGELTASLDELLHRFVNLLAEHGNAAWGKSDEDLVRRARAALTNAGHPPQFGHETLAHLEYQLLDGSG